MNVLFRNFIYMSQLIGMGAYDSSSGRKIGRVRDIAANLKEMYPKVSSVIVKKRFFGGEIAVPLKSIKLTDEGKKYRLEFPAETAQKDAALAENDVLLRETFWDKQIVDISGSKVVRVNDLHFLREEPNLWAVHVDVGFKGFVRRLGWTRWFEPAVKWLFSYELRDRLISWKYVQPVTADKGGSRLSLKGPRTKLTELDPADLADILAELGTDERLAVLKTLDNSVSANTLKELPLKLRVQTAELLETEKLAHILSEMPVDEAVDLMAHFPRKKTSAVLSLLPKERAKQIKGLMEVPGRLAASIMNTQFAVINQAMTAGQALENVRNESKDKESIYYIYAVDDNDSLAGTVTLRQLLTVSPEKPVSEFMRKRVTRVKADTDIRDVAKIFYKYDFTVVPVVDRQGKVQGIITIKDALESVFPEIKEEIERQ